MRKIGIACIAAIVMLCSNSVVGQIDNEIRNYVDSTELLLDNGRKILLNSLAKGDNEKANEVYAFLVDLTKDTGFKAFYYSETLLVNMLSQNFTEFLDKAANYVNYVNDARYNTTVPLNDVLHQEIGKRKEQIEKAILNSSHSDEEKQILLIFLKLVNESDRSEGYYSMVRDYRRQYTTSNYVEFVKKYIPGPQINASYNMHMGSSWLFPTGELANNFRSGPGFSFGMDFNIGNVYSSLTMTGGNLFLKEPFVATTEFDVLSFQKDDNFSYFDAGLEGGYFLVRSDRFHFTPFVSLSMTNLRSTMYETEDSKKEIDIFNCAALGAGIHTEVKIFEFEAAPYYGYGYPMKSYLSVKFDAGCRWLTKTEHSEFKGNIAYARLAFIWGFGDF